MVNKMINNIKELIKIDKKEVLRYLQYKNQNINEDLSNLIDERWYYRFVTNGM